MNNCISLNFAIQEKIYYLKRKSKNIKYWILAGDGDALRRFAGNNPGIIYLLLTSSK